MLFSRVKKAGEKVAKSNKPGAEATSAGFLAILYLVNEADDEFTGEFTGQEICTTIGSIDKFRALQDDSNIRLMPQSSKTMDCHQYSRRFFFNSTPSCP